MSSSTNATTSVGFSSDWDGATTICIMDTSPFSARLHDFIKILPKGKRRDKSLLVPEYNNQKLSAKISKRIGNCLSLKDTCTTKISISKRNSFNGTWKGSPS